MSKIENEIILRFSLAVVDESISMQSILKDLVQQDIESVAENVSLEWTEKAKQSWIDYKIIFNNVHHITECTDEFCNIWKAYSLKLLELRDIGFFFDIIFEITVTNWNFPALSFDKQFIDFTSKHGITFGLYFWSGDAEHNQHVD